jgi:hypothetical protein
MNDAIRKMMKEILNKEEGAISYPKVNLNPHPNSSVMQPQTGKPLVIYTFNGLNWMQLPPYEDTEDEA